MQKTARAHTNIALVKYWGKKDAKLKLPFNSSLSMTLDAFYTDTTFKLISQTDQNQFFLNNQLISFEKSQRVFNYVKMLQKRFQVEGNFVVSSNNHVPTSAGLASSASAFAALATAFCAAYELEVDKTELSRLARLGSGSATRSIYGGFVEWQAGDSDENSIALPISAQPSMDLQLLAVEIDTREKTMGSTVGMDLVVNTSPYYKTWIKEANKAVSLMKEAIKAEDFTTVGKIAQESALAMHALNLTAKPGFTYFQPSTIKGMQIIDELNHNGIECYYTIDAGPNLKVLTKLRNVKEILNRFKEELPNVKIIQASFGPGVQILN